MHDLAELFHKIGYGLFVMGRVVWTAGWFLLVVPHPVAVWEVVVNKDCEMWSHRDGFGSSCSCSALTGWRKATSGLLLHL